MEHLRDKHKEDIAPGREMLFDTWDEFFNWKNSEEVRTFSYYSQQFGRRDNRAYFYCQHDDPSGGVERIPEESAERRKRGPNQKGRIKVGKLCFSMIHVHGVNKEGQLRVTYFPTHSHKPDAVDLKFQPTNAATRKYIKRQIANGLSAEKISERLKEEKSVFESGSRAPLRSDFISVRAIKEQKRLYSKTVNCLDDERVHEIVDNLLDSPNDPVLIFKPAGGAVVAGPETANVLPEEIFILGIQTKDQLEMTKKLCKSLIIDVNCDVTHYGCKLLTVFGVDDMNRGYPLAHYISSNMDELVLKQFFCALREKCPYLRISALLTEGFDPRVINAARTGLGDDSIQHFVCIWSFLKDLQRKLHAKIEDGALVSSMFEDLCELVLAKTEAVFAENLSEFRSKYSESHPAFMRYFNCICIPKKTKWALCFRETSHTVLYAQSFHNTLKSTYVKQELSKGLETLLQLLLQTEEDYYSKRHSTGIFTSPSRRAIINDNVKVRHSKASALTEVKQVIKNRLWAVSSKNCDKVHQVVSCNTVCTNPNDCFIRCADCTDLCVHLYLCTCKDQNPLCKHIHKIHSAIPKRQTGESHDVETEKAQREKILSLLTKLRDHVESHAVQTLHPLILKTLAELNTQCTETRIFCRKTADQFTPPITYVDDPNKVIFHREDEAFSLVSLKSLEPWLPPSEVDILEKATGGRFRLGCIYENILNTYLCILSTTFVDFTPFHTSVMTSLITSDKETFETFWGSLQTQRVIFIPIVSDHYTCAAVLVEEAMVVCYDPLVESLIDDESLDALKRGLALAFPRIPSWSQQIFAGTQGDVAESGINVCLFAEQVAKGDYQIVPDQHVVRNFRKTVYDTIFGYCLKRPTYIHNRCDICKEVAITSSTGTIKCARCSQLFHRMCLQLDPDETCICPLILVESDFEN